MDNKGYKNALLVSGMLFGKEKPAAPLQGCAASSAVQTEPCFNTSVNKPHKSKRVPPEHHPTCVNERIQGRQRLT